MSTIFKETADLNLEKAYELYRKRNKGSIIRSIDYFNFLDFKSDLASKIGLEATCLLSYLEKFNFLSTDELKALILPSEFHGENFDKYLKILKDHRLVEFVD